MTATTTPPWTAAAVTPSTAPGDSRRTELLALVVIVLAAFVARYWAFGATGMMHFDEGVYAISASGLLQSPYQLFPGQINFSPPFYFTSVGVVARVFGAEPDRVAVLLNILFGTATVLAVWWIGRAWFGARAAIIAAMLLAFSQFHILMSRVVLTDAAFALWFVLGLGALTQAIDRRSYRLAILAGVIVGLAWNTKYHGWFVLLITGAALVPGLWRARASGEWRTPVTLWLTAAVVSLVLYLPWAAYIRIYSGSGGYGSILQYYSTMLSIDWFGNLARQARQQVFLEGTLSRAAPLLALAAGLLVRRGRSVGTAAWITIGLAAGALLIGQAGVAALLALAGIPMLLRDFDRYHARVLLCWVGLWVVAAPVYHPYARLILPFTIASFLLTGLVIDRLLGGSDAGLVGSRQWPPAGIALAAAVVVALATPVLRDDVSDPWRRSRDLAAIADSIALRTGEGDVVHVLGEPPLAHYLRRAGRRAPPRVSLGVLDTISKPAYLVTGRYTDVAPMLRNRVSAMSDRLTKIGVYAFDPNDLRLLDDLRPAAARRYRAARDSTFDLTLYRVAPRTSEPAAP